MENLITEINNQLIANHQIFIDVIHFSYTFTIISAFVFGVYAIGSISEWVWNGGISDLIEEYQVERHSRIAKEVISRMCKILGVQSLSDLAYKAPEDIKPYAMDGKFLTELKHIRKLSSEVSIEKLEDGFLASDFIATQKHIVFMLRDIEKDSFL